ncbi:MAG: YjgP/YjgQ family permease [Puniceicoccaceae bacterium]|nr:MAG: YjgP/YjgQ family permease [Puniceicoccaceae bacterium]
MGLRLIDRYLLGEWLKMFGLLLAATFGLLLLQEMYENFRDLLDYGAGPRTIAFYFLIVSPALLPVVLPLSILISLLYTFGHLHRNNEFTALRCAGLTLFRLTRWIWVVGLLFSALLLALNSRVAPWSVEQSRLLLENLAFEREVRQTGDREVGLVYNLAFDNRRDGRLWFINRFSAYTHHAFGITVSELDDQRREVRRLMAAEGFFDEVEDTWHLLAGRELVFNPETGDLVRPIPFERRTIGGTRDDPRLMLMLTKRPKDLSFFELHRILATFDEEEFPPRPRYEVRYHGILANSLGCLIVMGLAIPFAIAGVRVNPAVGVAKSIGLFLVYYLVLSLANLLGDQGTLPPLVAAWVPNLSMLLVAAWLMRRVA